MMHIQRRYKVNDMITEEYQVYDIKEGGMGTVYLCRSRRYRPLLFGAAMKAIKDEYLTNSRIREQFYHEAYLWMKLGDHPNIVACRAVKSIHQQLFLILDLIPGIPGLGSDLKTWIAYRGFDPISAVSTMLNACYGLNYAYEKLGLIHRDLKPQNILFDDFLGVHVTDFGLAASVRGNMSLNPLTEQNSFIGTPPYMSPEQCRSEPLDLRSDIYAVGCILYELLSGQKVFLERNFNDLVSAMLYKQPKPLIAVIPDIPASLHRIVTRCLEKDPNNRYPNYSELIDDLQSALNEVGGEIPTAYPSSSDLDQTTTAQYLKARSLRELGHVAEALAIYQAITPNDEIQGSHIRYEKAVCLAILERNEEAEAEFRWLVETYPNHSQLMSDFANFLMVVNKTSEALQYIQKAIDLEPTLSGAHTNAAYILSQLGREDEAVIHLKEALRADNNDEDAWLNMGVYYRENSQFTEALACFRRAVDIAPAFARAWHNIGLTHSALAAFEEALTAFTEAISRNSNEQYMVNLGHYDTPPGPSLDPAAAYLARGGTLMQLKRYPEAKSDMLTALKLYSELAHKAPDRAIHANNKQDVGSGVDTDKSVAQQAYEQLARCCLELQQFDEALSWLRKVLEIDPIDVETYLLRVSINMEHKYYHEALEDLNIVIQLDPLSKFAFHARASLLDDLGLYEEALADYNRAVQLEPNNASIVNDRGFTYQNLGQYEMALADYSRAIELDPEFILAYHNSGFAHMTLNRMHDAIIDYTNIIKLDQSNAIAYFRRGTCYHTLQAYEQALVDYGQAIALDSTNANACYYIGVILEQQNQLPAALLFFEQAVQLGFWDGAAAVMRVRQRLGMEPIPQRDPAQQAIIALQQADSLAAMQQTVTNFPLLRQPDFIAAIEQAIAQLPPEHRPAFTQRLAWLGQIAKEQNP